MKKNNFDNSVAWCCFSFYDKLYSVQEIFYLKFIKIYCSNNWYVLTYIVITFTWNSNNLEPEYWNVAVYYSSSYFYCRCEWDDYTFYIIYLIYLVVTVLKVCSLVSELLPIMFFYTRHLKKETLKIPFPSTSSKVFVATAKKCCSGKLVMFRLLEILFWLVGFRNLTLDCVDWWIYEPYCVFYTEARCNIQRGNSSSVFSESTQNGT